MFPRIETVEDLEAVIGRASAAVAMKQVDVIDEGCRAILALSPVAGCGYRDEEGQAVTTVIGGERAFVKIESATRLSFELPASAPRPGIGGGISFVFLLPGVGETLRLGGKVVRAWPRVLVAMEEAFVHCAMCVVRSGIWGSERTSVAPLAIADGPLATPEIAAFLAAAPFAVVSTWSDRDASDTSPRGDPAGFLRALDGHTLVLPDRKGNQRADTFRNLLSCDTIALAALAPGREELLEVTGTAYLTTEPALLASLPPLARPPQAALVIHVTRARLAASEPVRAANLWSRASHVTEAPDLMAIAGRHLARGTGGGVLGAILRFVGAKLAAYPALTRRLIDAGYRKQAAVEGHAGRTVRIAEIRRETPDAVTLLLEDPTGAPFHFKPGQFFTVDLRIRRKPVKRSYSASCLPGGKTLALTIKRVDRGLASTHINGKLRAGDTLTLHGPSGSFLVEPDASATRELVLVAGGSGITPMMSIAASILALEPGTKLTLLYGNRSLADAIFADALATLARDHGARFTVRHVVQHADEAWTGGKGILDAATVAAELDALDPSPDAHFYVCGPAPMMRGTRRALLARGIPATQIHEESFAPPTVTDAPTKPQPMTVVRAGATLATVEVPAGKTLLQAGLKASLPMAYSCSAGSCGECMLHLVEGEVTMAEPNALTPDERAKGCILACVARPRTPVKVELP